MTGGGILAAGSLTKARAMPDLAPPILASEWLNTPEPLTLDGLRGRVVAIVCFQMLCPGCVSHGLPQAGRIAQTFRAQDVAVIGLHCVFEHHAAMTPVSLGAFLHEYRIRLPVAVDLAGDGGPLPQTMAAYALEGTPTLLLIDRAGHLRAPFRAGVRPCPRGRNHDAGSAMHRGLT